MILAVGFNTTDNPVIELKMKQAAEAGAKVVLVNPEDYVQHIDFLNKAVYTKNDLSFLKEVAKAVVDSGGVQALTAMKSSQQALRMLR